MYFYAVSQAELERENYCTQAFVAIDRWLTHAGEDKGNKALKIVRDNFQNNIKANVTYYASLAKEAEKNGQKKLAARHKLLVRLYKELLKADV